MTCDHVPGEIYYPPGDWEEKLDIRSFPLALGELTGLLTDHIGSGACPKFSLTFIRSGMSR